MLRSRKYKRAFFSCNKNTDLDCRTKKFFLNTLFSMNKNQLTWNKTRMRKHIEQQQNKKEAFEVYEQKN